VAAPVVQALEELVTGRDRILKTTFYLVVIVTTVVVVFPFYWMFVNALQSGSGRFAFPVKYVPDNWAFFSFLTVLRDTAVGRWLLNSFAVSSASAAIAIVLGSWGAYAISRFRSRGVRTASYLILATQMMPPVVLMIPLFIIIRQMGLVDTLQSLVLVNAIFTLPVTTWMLKSIFDSIPVELEEAGMVDGCTRMGVLWRITIPIAIPGLIAAGLFAFIASWDEYMFARTVITNPRLWVGTIGIVSFIGEWQAPWDQINAAAFLFTLVPVALFLMVQKYFIVGIVGGVKG
jgi:multiple sugar transport system permease protein